MINSLRAVQAALSYHDANGNPRRQGDALLVAPDTLAATDCAEHARDVPGAGHQRRRSEPQIVRPRRADAGPADLGTPRTPSRSTRRPTRPSSTALGAARAYVEQDFTVPAGAQRLDAAISLGRGQHSRATLVRLTLFDPQGRFAAYSQPQDAGRRSPRAATAMSTCASPAAGTWRAIIWTRASAAATAAPSTSTSRPPTSSRRARSSRHAHVLAPGQTGTFTVVRDARRRSPATRAPASPLTRPIRTGIRAYARRHPGRLALAGAARAAAAAPLAAR